MILNEKMGKGKWGKSKVWIKIAIHNYKGLYI